METNDATSLNEELDFGPVETAWSKSNASRRGKTFGSRRTGFGKSRNTTHETSTSLPFQLPEIRPSPPRNNPFETRGTSLFDLTDRIDQHDITPKPHRASRSFSLNLGSYNSLKSPPLFASSPAVASPFAAENLHPNQELTAIEEPSTNQGRKKLKQRRNSMQGSFLSSLSSLSGFESDIEADKTAWKKTSSPPKELIEFQDKASFSPAPNSASSRKRTVEGTPRNLEDIDFSSSSLSASSSRSRILLTSRSLSSMPQVPSLQPNASPRPRPVFETAKREARFAAVDSEDDDSVFESDPDYSMDHGDDHGLDLAHVEPTFAFIRRMYHSLREEQSKQAKHPFGIKSWTVRIPTSWTSQERTNYIHWAKTLGFSLFVIGTGTPPLQISATRGAEILVELKEKVKYLDKAPGNNEVKSKKEKKPRAKLTRTQSIRGHTPQLSTPSVHDDTLAVAMERLSVNDNMARTVTLEADYAPSQREDPGTPSMSFMRESPTYLQRHGRESTVSKAERMSFGGRYMPEIMSQECFETPCMSQDQCGWGSRMVPGRDWGASSRCDGATLNYLIDLLDDAWNNAETERLSLASAGASEPVPFMPSDFGRHATFDIEEETIIDMGSPALEDKAMNDRRKTKKSFAKLHRMSIFASESLQSEHLPDNKKLFHSSRATLSPSKLFSTLHESLSGFHIEEAEEDEDVEPLQVHPFDDETLLTNILSYLGDDDLLIKAFSVSHTWADAATTVHAQSLMSNFGYEEKSPDSLEDDEDVYDDASYSPWYSGNLDRSWKDILSSFPWGQYLSDGTFKRVYKVHNLANGCEEAMAVMDLEEIFDKKVVGAELSVSVFCSSLVRRGICPNFVTIRGMFTSSHEPSSTRWGCEETRFPQGKSFDRQTKRLPKKPAEGYPGQYHYIRMELCNAGDAEDFVRDQPNGLVSTELAQSVIFQAAFALHAAADKFSMKHYDIKLLNIFLHKMDPLSGDVVLRYGIGSHVFAIRMDSEKAYMAKIADFGTANVKAHTNGKPVTIAQFSTLENTPPDFMILGDSATQGHGHDAFGLGLCMLHLFTGNAPYEEIMKDVVCPPLFRKKLKAIWENERVQNYRIIRNVILSDVTKDSAGNIIDGEPDETLYDTLYRFLVLFGIPKKFGIRIETKKVWNAIEGLLKSKDATDFKRHCIKFSLERGSDRCIARARQRLQEMPGAYDLLLRLCCFDPDERASALDVLNSTFMSNLLERPGEVYDESVVLKSYLSFATSANS